MKNVIWYDKNLILFYAIKIQNKLNKNNYCEIESKKLEKVKNSEGFLKF